MSNYTSALRSCKLVVVHLGAELDSGDGEAAAAEVQFVLDLLAGEAAEGEPEAVK